MLQSSKELWTRARPSQIGSSPGGASARSKRSRRGKIVGKRNEYWNAIKHFDSNAKKRTVREGDDALLARFSDQDNDAPLFAGWLDYHTVTRRLPIEVQVFQAWWFALNEDKLAPHVDPTPFRTLFPDIGRADRAEQKRRLRRKIESLRRNRKLRADPRTEQGPLLRRVP
jgi:hypothetical protein